MRERGGKVGIRGRKEKEKSRYSGKERAGKGWVAQEIGKRQ
jgi:hypothetical protein